MTADRRAMHTPAERVALARAARRPGAADYISALFEDFFEIHGDRAFGDDKAIVCGIGRFQGRPVTIAAHRKGRTLEENIACNFGMPSPEGYRKFSRCLGQAIKFGRPVITFIDTPGAYPGQGAEERGQGEAIARCLYQLSQAPVPVISVVTGEGGSGGALALGVADRVIMLENAVYSVLSPEGFASILWKDASRAAEACQVMKLTAYDLLEHRIIDYIVDEPPGGAQDSSARVMTQLQGILAQELGALTRQNPRQLTKARYARLRKIGL